MTESANAPMSVPTIHIYARADETFVSRIGVGVFAKIVDPNQSGTPEPNIVRAIEEAGSLDLNIALYDGKIGEAKPLEGFAAKLAESIAIDMMVVYASRLHPDIVLVDGHALAESCTRRIDKLVGAANAGRSAIPVQGGWYIIELMGQKRYSAFVTETYVAGQRVLQLEIPTDNEGKNRVTKFVGSRSAIYAITQCEERLALGIAHNNRPMPFESWEIRRMGSEELSVQADRLLGSGDPDDDENSPDSQDQEPSSTDDSADDDVQF